MNVFWLNITATTHVAADLKNIIDAMVASYATNLVGLMSSVYAQTGAKATWLYASGNALEYTGSYANPGTGSATAVSDSTCSVIDWAISDYYRGGHPRTYLPGLPAADLTSGRLLVAGFASTLATNATTWMNAVNALTHGGISAVTLGTVRFASGNAWLSPPVFRAYTSASVRSIVGTQRRRLAAT